MVNLSNHEHPIESTRQIWLGVLLVIVVDSVAVAIIVGGRLDANEMNISVD